MCFGMVVSSVIPQDSLTSTIAGISSDHGTDGLYGLPLDSVMCGLRHTEGFIVLFDIPGTGLTETI